MRAAGPLCALLCLLAAARARAASAEALDAASPLLASDSFAVQAISGSELQVTRPGSMREASSAMGAFVRSGKLAPGAAVEVTPWDLYFNGVTWREYLDNPWTRRLVNLAASLATTGGGETDPVRSAFAVRLRLWDDSDWRLNDAALACARRVLGPVYAPPDAPPDETVQVQPEISGERRDALAACRRDNTRWNASQAAVGAALTLGTPGGTFTQTRPDGGAGWVSIGVPLGDAFQLLASARASFHKAQSGLPGSQVAGLGTRLCLYTLRRLVLLLDTGLGAQHQGDWTGRALLGATAQVRLFGQTWGELAAAEDVHLESLADSHFSITANLKWNYDVTSSLR